MKIIVCTVLALALVLSAALVVTGPMSTPALAAHGPPVETGLVLHLDADAIDGLTDGEPVAQWDDLSGEGNDATQATPANQPTYKTGILNGRPVVRFDGASTYMATGAQTPAAEQPNTMFIVWSANAATHQFATDGLGAANRHIVQWHAADGLAMWSGARVAYAKATPFAHLMTTAIFDGIGSEIYEDGSLEATGNAGTHGYGGLTIGARYSAELFLDGDIAEILIYDSALSEEDREAVEQYLGVKWLGWEPEEVWVCTTGDDVSGDGSDGNPYATIQKGIDEVEAGGTVNVKAGTYEEDLVIPAGKDGLEIKGVANPTKPIIRGVAYVDYYPGRWNINILSSGVKLHGFIIESPDVPAGYYSGGIHLDSPDVEIYDNDFVMRGAFETFSVCVAIQTWRVDNLPEADISGLWIHGNTFGGTADSYQAIFLNRDTGEGVVTVENNEFSGNMMRAIVTERSNTVISGNEMTSDIASHGITIRDWDGREQENIEITGNEIEGFLVGLVIGEDDEDITGITVTGNTFADNAVQVRDRADSDLDLDDVVDDNTFDRAVVVRGSAIKVPTIFSKIQDGIDAADPGDTVEVYAGTYDESVVVDKADLTLRSTVKHGAEITGDGSPIPSLSIAANGVTVEGFKVVLDIEHNAGVSAIEIGADSVTLSGLDIQKMPIMHHGSEIKHGVAVTVLPGTDGFSFTDSVVDSAWNGIHVRHSPGSTNVEVRNVDFTYPGEYGILFMGTEGAAVEENSFTCTGDGYGVIVTREANDIDMAGNDFLGSGQGVGILLQRFSAGIPTLGTVNILENEIEGWATGLLLEKHLELLGGTAITVKDNEFTDNTVQVSDRAELLDLQAVLDDNTFDRAVVVRGSAIKVPTIFSKIQDAIDAAVDGETVQVYPGTYQERARGWVDLIIDKPLTLLGAGPDETVVELREGVTDGVYVSASDVTVEGIRFTKEEEADHAAGRNVRVGYDPAGTYSNITFRNVVIEHGHTNLSFEGHSNFSNIIIEGCDISRSYTERNVYFTGLLGGRTNAIDGLTVRYSTFNDAGTDYGPGNTPESFEMRGVTNNVLMENVEVSNNPYHGIVFWAGDNIILRNVTANNNAQDKTDRTGIAFMTWGKGQEITNVSIDDVTIEDSGGRGLLLWTVEASIRNVTITCGTITGAANYGIMVYNQYWWNFDLDNVTIRYLNLAGNGWQGVWTSHHVHADWVSLVDARWNWWGDAGGPGGDFGPGAGDLVSRDVVFHPWIHDVVDCDELPYMLDHFKVYEATGDPIDEPVLLEDQFGEYAATVLTPVFFGNPAMKEHEGVFTPIWNEDDHLTFYELEFQEWETQTWYVEVFNQFGPKGHLGQTLAQNFKVGDPVMLGVPTRKAPHGPFEGPDHYLLYEVIDGEPLEFVVGLTDQWLDEPEVVVLEPVYFANPVTKWHGEDEREIKNYQAHLVFYRIVGDNETELEAHDEDAWIVNQFDFQIISPTAPALLAVPADKWFESYVEVIANLETNLGDLAFGGTHFFHDDGVEPAVKLEGDDMPDFDLDVISDQAGTLSIYNAWQDLSTLQVVNVENPSNYLALELVAINILDDEGNPVPEAHLSNYGIAYNMYEGALHGGFVRNAPQPAFFSIGDRIPPGEVAWGVLTAHVQDGAVDFETYEYTIELEWREVAVEVIASIETNMGDLAFGGTHFFHDDGVEPAVKLEGDDMPDFDLDVISDQAGTLSIYNAWQDLSTLQVVNVENNGSTVLELAAINILDDEGNPVPEAHLSNYGIAYNMYGGALHGGFVYNTSTAPFFFSIGDQIAPGDKVWGMLTAHVQDGAVDFETYEYTIELEWITSSTYEFVYDVPDVIVACEKTVVPVTFRTDVLGAYGYDGVRFAINATGPGNVTFNATDTNQVEHSFLNEGFWGPSIGFPLPPDYTATTDFTLHFSVAGDYTITFSLIEAPYGPVIAGITDSVIVTVVEYVAEIQGYTTEVNCDILPGVTITLYSDDTVIATTVSDGAGNYTLPVPDFGVYTVVASKDGFRLREWEETIEVTENTTYTVNFVGKHGLIPNVIEGGYWSAVMSQYLYTVGECALDGKAFSDVMSAYLNPILP